MSHSDRRPGHFPSTWWDQLEDIQKGGDGSRRALDEFVRRYHEPVLRYLRRIVGANVGGDGVEDLVQAFFIEKILDGNLIKRADRKKGSFRVYLKAALRNYGNDIQRKRSGNPLAAPVNIEDVDESLLSAEATTDPEFDSAWLKAILDAAERIVRAKSYEKEQAKHFELFRSRWPLRLSETDAAPTWKQLADPQGVDERTAYDLELPRELPSLHDPPPVPSKHLTRCL